MSCSSGYWVIVCDYGRCTDYSSWSGGSCAQGDGYPPSRYRESQDEMGLLVVIQRCVSPGQRHDTDNWPPPTVLELPAIAIAIDSNGGDDRTGLMAEPATSNLSTLPWQIQQQQQESDRITEEKEEERTEIPLKRTPIVYGCEPQIVLLHGYARLQAAVYAIEHEYCADGTSRDVRACGHKEA